MAVVQQMLHGTHRDLRNAYDVRSLYIAPNDAHVHAHQMRLHAGRLLQRLAQAGGDETQDVVTGLVIAAYCRFREEGEQGEQGPPRWPRALGLRTSPEGKKRKRGDAPDASDAPEAGAEEELGSVAQRILMCVCEFIAAKLAGAGAGGACPASDRVTVSRYARRCDTRTEAFRMLELRVLNAVKWRL